MRQARRPGIFERPAWPDEGFGLACLSQAQAQKTWPGPVTGRQAWWPGWTSVNYDQIVHVILSPIVTFLLILFLRSF